jgi:hypothetical protein
MEEHYIILSCGKGRGCLITLLGNIATKNTFMLSMAVCMGKGIRIHIPKCMLNHIRVAYPDEVRN